mmetsp:Transcript_28438/g.64710  ORF Transcript_28438/g.64710 Transcript_28438/m.64710 type:complete len:84 (-) Transcript_28438:907-1158(-)
MKWKSSVTAASFRLSLEGPRQPCHFCDLRGWTGSLTSVCHLRFRNLDVSYAMTKSVGLEYIGGGLATRQLKSHIVVCIYHVTL